MLTHLLPTAAIGPHLDGGAIEGPGAELCAQQGMGFAHTAHELATNAAQYGALSNEVGRIAVTWDIEPNGVFRFHWLETGGQSEACRPGAGSARA